MVKGKTKSGIKYQLNEAIKDDARVLYILVQMNREDVDVQQKGRYVFDLLEMMFGKEGVPVFMNEVAAVHGGVCKIDAMIAELTEMFDALKAKNS